MAFLRNPWIIGGFGVAAVALIIWYVGPLLGFGESRPFDSWIVRLVLISLITLGWLGYRLFRHLQAKKATEEISSGIVEGDDGNENDARSAEEVATLKARFEEAMQVLKKTGGGKAVNLYELPWYMIIGPPGAGKTTALVNSGLRFPLSDRFGKNALRGVGGTRNCDWWFTEEAILLDTAGRYTTQDSQAAVDRAAWEGFLELLKKYRKRRPINGVIVAFSVTDFMDPEQRRTHAAAIKNRIQELDDYFGMRFPVYVLITKCDLVSGFIEYFEDLSADEREQVWGLTLPLDETGQQTGTGEQVGRELEALFARVEARMLSRLHQERDVKRRGLLYSFPQQIHSLKGPLVELIDDIFRSSRFEDAAMLRGVYFSSGTQEGTPIDRVMASVSRTFGVEAQALPSYSGQGRSYFLTRLLQKVVFQEAGIAGTNQKVERRRAWMQRAAYAGVFVLVGLLLTGWTLSYFGNSALLDEVQLRTAAAEAKLNEVPSNRYEPEVTREALTATASIIPADEEIGFTGLGLDQSEALGEQAQAAYRRSLINQLLPRVMLRLEQQIKQPRVPMDYTYEALKAYLRLGIEQRYDPEEIGAWVTLDWSARLPREMGQENYQELVTHLIALVEERPVQLPLPLDETLIRQARSRLMRMSMEERIYARLKGANVVQGMPGFTVFERAGPESLEVFVRDSGQSLSEGIAPFFTRRGFETIFTNSDSFQLVKDLSSETWVLRDEVDLSDALEVNALLLKLRDLYFKDYVNEYQQLIYDLELAPFKDAREAARILNILARPADSPLLNLIAEVSKETDFSAVASSADGDEASEGDAFSAQRERLQQLLGETEQVAQDRYQAKRYANVVEEEFAEFHALSGPAAGSAAGASPMGHLLSLLRELADFMMLVSGEESAGGVPQHIVQRGQASIEKTQFEAQRQNIPLLEGLLKAAAVSVDNIASGGAATNIESQWQAGPLRLCQQAIDNRYPVSRTAQAEIRLEDFGRFFGSGGEADKFFEAYLKDKIDTTTRPWRAAVTRGVQIRPDAIKQFERAQAIRDTFFRGDATPYVGFELTPISMDPSVTQFSLTVDGQSTQYFHGPLMSQSFDWPGPQGVGEVRIEMSPGAGTPMRTLRGPWAWFRFLDESNMRPAERPEHFEVVFKLGARSATYELVARSAYNPFKLDELVEFRCPARLTQ